MKKTVSMIALATLPFLSLSAAQTAIAQEQICSRSTAREAASAQDYQTLCDCGVVTRGFLNVLQQRSDFADTLQNTSALCPGLASLLSDLPTASTDGGSDYDNDISGIDFVGSSSPSTAGTGPSGGGDDDTGGGDDDTGGGQDNGNGGGQDNGNGGGQDSGTGGEKGDNGDGGGDDTGEGCTFDC